MLNNEKFCTFLEFSWMIIIIALASSILFLIMDLPERVFLSDKTKIKSSQAKHIPPKRFSIKLFFSNNILNI